MTDPAARPVSPRRTVRVAVALVAGQAALCAVIGWVTFGPSEAKPDAAGVRPLIEPIPLPTVQPFPLKAAPQPTRPSAAKASSWPRPSRSSRPARSRATSKPATRKPRPVVASQRSPSESPARNPGVAASPPPPSPSEEVQSGVVAGRPCDPDGANGRTVDLTELQCTKDADGDLVWQIN